MPFWQLSLPIKNKQTESQDLFYRILVSDSSEITSPETEL